MAIYASNKEKGMKPKMKKDKALLKENNKNDK